MTKTEGPAELKPIEQLDGRIRSLIEVLGNTRDELKLAMDENTRLTGEVEELRGKLQQQETQTREMQSERDEIRERITGMLEQLEELGLQ